MAHQQNERDRAKVQSRSDDGAGNPSTATDRALSRNKAEEIVLRITNKLGIPDLVDRLAALQPKDLSSLMMRVYEIRAAGKTPLDILNQYTDNVLTNIADADPRSILKLEAFFYDRLPSEFERVELSILNPLGANAALTPINHKTVFSATREVEVLADISVALAMETARRRRVFMRTPSLVNSPVCAASCQRVARLRQRPTEPGFNAHWKMIGMASAGREASAYSVDFAHKALVDHVRVYAQLFTRACRASTVNVLLSDVSLMEGLLRQKGLSPVEVLHRANNGEPTTFEALSIDLPGRVPDLNEDLVARLHERELSEQVARLRPFNTALEVLRREFPQFNFEINLERTAGMNYYRNLCMHFEATNAEGERLIMVDGGNPDWTQKLLSDKRETVFVSGMGSELFVRKFGFADLQ